ncbi:MAG TPA: vitamin B12-dependent ribonucleotide reductase [Candidatus Binatia bacterium]|nr:vitamin B12-dependent ribonucleotide reductase [Candidatus Binatia bacterium]
MPIERSLEQGRDEREARSAAPEANPDMHRESTPEGTPDRAADGRPERPAISLRRHFVPAGGNPADEVEWDVRSAVIQGEGGETVFEQRDVEVPRAWSQLATNVVVSKYFRGPLGTPQRERSVRQLIGRVVTTIAEWGTAQRYFVTPEDQRTFEGELTHLLLQQKLSFNSPVWFNVGVEPKPQCSACFILSVEDTMDSILDWYRKEGIIFKGGSGSGVNLSRLRSSKERLGGGGTASGPVSFMRAADASAGVIKSGGKTRRAAKMVVLDADHPDIVEFIRCKAEEERKAWALIAAGYDSSLDGPAYGSIFFQNANNSVRVTDEFMRAAAEGRSWSTRFVTSGDVAETYPAHDLLRMIAEATHQCGDPGMQFDTTINAWHTCPNSGRINASNPCSEYMHLDDSACNLASLNLMRFVDDDGNFDVASFTHAVDVAIMAQDILVDRSSYPTEAIARNAHAFRELGLGYANLGALLMSLGLPYDSEAGREYAAAVTALMCGRAYRHSARVAAALGPYEGYAVNRDAQLRVIDKHRGHAYRLNPTYVPLDLLAAARESWDEALALARDHGVRNSQVTVLAPTGTIAFMLDCDTTGVEPDIALVKYKKLVGGGMLKIVNTTVPRALKRLGYDSREVQSIVEYIDEQETIEGAPDLRPEHLAVFDCAFKPARGIRSIAPLGHVRMMAAVQPFISGAISKTINMPEQATVEDIEQAYVEAWRLGLKAVAIYRDGCKKTQPLNTAKPAREAAGVAEPAVAAKPVRRRLPADRQATCHKFDIAGHEGYIHVGFFEDGTPGEIFIKMAKEGSTISGLMDTVGVLTSMALQYGVPLEVLVSKFSHVRFEPSGFTKNSDIPMAKSLIDYIFRFLGTRFLSGEQRVAVGLLERHESAGTPQAVVGGATAGDGGRLPRPSASLAAPALGTGAPASHPIGFATSLASGQTPITFSPQADAPSCPDCGSLMVRNGACYKCFNCGATSGCS